MILSTNSNGYTLDWKQDTNSICPNYIFYDNISFLEVYIEFFLHSFQLKITVIASESNGPITGSPAMISGTFTLELLQDFGLDVRDHKTVASNPEKFLNNVLKITSQIGYWSKAMNKLKYNTKSYDKYGETYSPNSPVDTIYSYKDSNHEINFLNNSVIEEQKREIERQNTVINQLKEELEELKEEMELLKAMNQEC
jgi:predicted ribosome quality control (RQC) complex YloA/Tae2 family protein